MQKIHLISLVLVVAFVTSTSSGFIDHLMPKKFCLDGIEKQSEQRSPEEGIPEDVSCLVACKAERLGYRTGHYQQSLLWSGSLQCCCENKFQQLDA